MAESALEIPTEPVTTLTTDLTTVTNEEQLEPADEAILSADTGDTAVVTPERRKPGRPVGSKSKEPGKPRAPRKKRVVIEEAPVEEPPQEPESALRESDALMPRVLPGSRPIPTRSHDDTTALMLSLLQAQAQQRQTRKSDLWKSWFR